MKDKKSVKVDNSPTRKGRMFIAICAMFGFFFMVFAVVFIKIPEVNRDLFLIMVGTLGGGFGAVIGRYLGVSEPEQNGK